MWDNFFLLYGGFPVHGVRPWARSDGRPGDQGRDHVPDPADLALRRRAGGGRRAVDVHVRSDARRDRLYAGWL